MPINALTRITVIYAHVTAHNKYTTVEPVHLLVHRYGVTYQYPLWYHFEKNSTTWNKKYQIYKVPNLILLNEDINQSVQAHSAYKS